MKKKWITWLLCALCALACAFGFAACGEEEPSKKQPELLTFTQIVFEDKTVTYNGEEQTITVTGTLPEGAKVVYENNAKTNAGTYTAKATISKEGYKTLTLTATFTIKEAAPEPPEEPELKEFTGITFANKEVTYNGEEQTITITGTLPEGAKVVYENNAKTNAGTYTAKATISKEGYKTLTLTATFTVKKATFTGIEYKKKTFVGAGIEHTHTVSGTVPEGTEITYSGNVASAAGDYTATATLKNPNYETLVLTANYKIIAALPIAANVLSSVLDLPDPWSFLPEAFRPENMALDRDPVTDFTEFVSASSIETGLIGKQMNVLYGGLTKSKTVLGYADKILAVSSTIANVYQKFMNDDPDNYASFTGEAGGFKLRITLNGDEYTLLAGNSLFSAEFYYNGASHARGGRIQLTDGVVLRYTATENSLKFAYKAGVSSAAVAMQIEFIRQGDAVTGYMYEYMGVGSAAIKTSATLAFNRDLSVIMSDKRETDDLKINGYEEVYDSQTGTFLGGRVKETVKVADYDTYWVMLNGVTGFNNVKVLPDQNGVNADTVYVNNSSDPFVAKKVGGISTKTASRRYDIEMKEVYYIVKTEEDGNVEYEKKKAFIPMLFVQAEQVSSFGKDVKESNASFASAPVLPDLDDIAVYYDVMQELFLTVKEEVGIEEITLFLGAKNEFFQKTEE